ncbi:MAG: Dabb family protein [Candidatus Eisenbacteria bacterium]|jgi:hypothetical protein|nr:Dabb family protein [Candidatus Eisenbacteria bacterium]
MIRHIVMWTLKESADGKPKAQNAVRMRDALEGMRPRIPEILRLEVGLNAVQGPEAFDVVLVADFATRDDLERYQAHPAHEQVKVFVRTVRETRAVVDYEVP